MHHMARRLQVALSLTILSGTLILLCRSLGITVKMVTYAILIGWGVMAVIVLVIGVTVPLRAKARPLPPLRWRRKARTATGTPVTVEGEH